MRRKLPAVWTLLLAVLVMRALVPSGWMPDFEGASGFNIRICGPADIAPGDAPEPMAHAMHGEGPVHDPHAEHDADAAHMGAPCMFSGFANAAPPPDAPTLASVAMPVAPVRTVEPLRIALIRARFLEPPAHAPPVHV